MKIIKTPKYLRDLKALDKKHLTDSLERDAKIENVLILHDNLKDLRHTHFWNIYRFEQLNQNLKEKFSCRIDKSRRIIFKPINDYPYEYEDVVEINLEEVSEHYKK